LLRQELMQQQPHQRRQLAPVGAQQVGRHILALPVRAQRHQPAASQLVLDVDPGTVGNACPAIAQRLTMSESSATRSPPTVTLSCCPSLANCQRLYTVSSSMKHRQLWPRSSEGDDGAPRLAT
jgi:hypothetical protein